MTENKIHGLNILPLPNRMDLSFLLTLFTVFVFSLFFLSPAQAKYAAIVLDASNGKIYHAENIDTRNYPASMTKMMTLYLLFDQLKTGRMTLSTPIKISAHAASMEPSKLGLRPGSTIRTEDAILALVTKSANDIAVAVGEHIGGTERNFARMMTQKARQLGMSRTTFKNASGLPNKGQLSTARDMATLSRALIHNHQKYYHYFSRTSFTYQGRTYGNHNTLMKSYRGMDGLKTGYIRAAGFNLAASAVRDGRRLIGVVFGGKTSAWRNARMASILDKGFRLAPPGYFAGIPERNPRHTYAAVIPDQPIPSQKPSLLASLDQQGLTSLFISTAHAAPPPLKKPLSATDSRLIANPPVPSHPPVQEIAYNETKLHKEWGVQIGAYSSKLSTENILHKTVASYPEVLADATPKVSSINTGKDIFYRARLMGLEEGEAKQLCRLMSAKGHSCLELPPVQ